jgi:hypothetical protein
MPERSRSLTRAALRVDLKPNDVDHLRPELTQRFGGREPSEGDLRWAYLNKRLVEYMSQRSWGLYRNTKLTMAACLYHEGRISDALQTLCEVMFLDVNGCRNRGTMTKNGVSAPMPGPDFEPELAYPAPAVVSAMLDLADELDIDEDELSKVFVERATASCGKMGAPYTIERAWQAVSAILFDRAS